MLTQISITPEPKLEPLSLSLDTDDPSYTGWERQSVRYTATILYSGHERSDQLVVAKGGAQGASLTLDFGDNVQGGLLTVSGQLFLYKQEDDGDHFDAKDVTVTVNILGSNPAKESIRQRIGSLPLQVISYMESRFRQFDSDGQPLFGTPHGFGVMQLDTPPPTARQVWDWTQNIDGGIALFAEKRAIAQAYLNTTKSANPDVPDWTADQWSLELYRLYNGGHYWIWNSGENKWQINPVNPIPPNPRGYAEKSKAIEDSVRNGKPPADWE